MLYLQGGMTVGFMSSYKRLDRLCRDLYPEARNGISGYIEDMQRHPANAHRVPGWREDCDRLKHYRWIRNQIAHEVDADEENMCSFGDVEWLDHFYQRILNRTDPLAQAFRMSCPVKRKETAPPVSAEGTMPDLEVQNSRPAGCAVLLIAVLAVMVTAAVWLGC